MRPRRQRRRLRMPRRGCPGSAGAPVATLWDPSLADATARRDLRIEEELSPDTLIADLT